MREWFQGLVITEEEINTLLADSLYSSSNRIENYSSEDCQTLVNTPKQLEVTIHQRKQLSVKCGTYLALPRLSEVFQLTRFAERCLLICLAPELERRYEKIYAFIQDDVTRKKPSIDLVLSLLCSTRSEKLAARAEFTPSSPLIRYRLLQINENPSNGLSPLISRFLKLDDRIINFLLECNSSDDRLFAVSKPVDDSIRLGSITVSKELKSLLQSLIHEQHPDSGKKNNSIVFHLHGRYGSGRHALSRWIAKCR